MIETSFTDIIGGIHLDTKCDLCDQEEQKYMILTDGPSTRHEIAVCRGCLSLYFEWRTVHKVTRHLGQMPMNLAESRIWSYGYVVGQTEAPEHKEHCKGHHSVHDLEEGQWLTCCTVCGFAMFGVCTDISKATNFVKNLSTIFGVA